MISKDANLAPSSKYFFKSDLDKALNDASKSVIAALNAVSIGLLPANKLATPALLSAFSPLFFK